MKRTPLTIFLIALLTVAPALSQHRRRARVTGSANATSSGRSNAPEGATARCRDGTYSYSKHRRGTCSHHGGVAEWLRSDIPN